MPVTLAKIANDTAEVTLNVGDEILHVTYYPGRVTEKTIAQIQQFETMSGDTIAESFAGLNDIFVSLIKKWDLYEDEEQSIVFPLVANRLSELPIIFRAKVLSTIIQDMRPETVAP